MNEVESAPTVAICLYGPGAGMLAVTRSSVWTRVLDVLAYHGWHADVYIHGYDPWIEDVPRAVAYAGPHPAPASLSWPPRAVFL